MLETQLSDLTVNTQGDATASLLDNGYVDVFTGPKFQSADEAVSTQVVLVTLSFGRPAFKKTVGGVMVSNPLSPGMGLASGDPVQFRAYTSDRRSAVFGGTAGQKNANMLLPVKTIVEGVTVGCSGLTHTIVKAIAGN